MKNIAYLLFALLIINSSCKKENIKLYQGDNYIQFSKVFTDSLLFSFLTIPDSDEGEVFLPVEIVGQLADRDRVYKLSVVKEMTTALDQHFSFPENFVLKANSITDTAMITVKRTPAIDIKPVKLVLKIEETADFKPGQVDHSFVILYISNVVSRPGWWNPMVEGQYLGTYSDKKYKLFSEVTKVTDLDPINQDQLRYYTIIFKNYLLREKDAGRTVLEENGSEMTVSLSGG